MKQRSSSSSSGSLSVRDCIAAAQERLTDSESARLDAEVLCAHALGITRSALLARLPDALTSEVVTRFDELVARREKGEPVAYILGTKEFWGLDFEVCPDVLIPRPESELLVQEALAFCAGLSAAKIVDLGTGSGCLAITVVHELLKQGKKPHCVAVDVSEGALNIAQRNAAAHGVTEPITFFKSDWFAERERFFPPYDLIIANPPYVDRAENTPRELAYEPSGALFSDEGGLRDSKIIIEQALSMLRPGGCLLVEVGGRKRAALAAWLNDRALPCSWQFLGDERACDSFTVVRLTPHGG